MKARTKKMLTWSIATLLILAMAGGYYFYQEYNRRLPDTSHLKADLAISSSRLIKDFEDNDSLAGRRFLDKVVEVNGPVREIQKDEAGLITVVLGDSLSASSVRCTVDSSHTAEFDPLQNGQTVRLKGICTGFNRDELLGSDVLLVRCVISKQTK